MVVKSPEPTLFCVITLCVWLSDLYDQDVPSLEFFVFSVVVAFIVLGDLLLGRDGWVVIPLGNIICLNGERSRRGWGVLGKNFLYFSLFSSSRS